MGAVYLGQHTLLGRRAAIKVLLPALSARPDIVNRFFNEARAVTSISDPGIVQVFDFGYHSDGSAFIVMEFLEGEPLDQRLAKLRRFSVYEALRLCRQVATSLAAAHAQNIVHRDLKPENIFLVRDAEVASGERSKILDFGIAKLADDPGKIKTHAGALMGTPVYMSPEQCRGLPEIDHRSDIYALGCVLFHLITGRPPFEGEGMGDIISAHIREPAPVPSSRAQGIPPTVDALLLRCLAKSPADRYQSMGELAAAIGQLLQHLPPDAVLHHGHSADGGQVASVPPTYYSRPATPSPPTPPPGYALAAAPTTLGASSGQIARPSRGSPRVGRWIAGLLVLGATGAGIAIVATRNDDGPRVVATHEPGAASPVEPPGASPRNPSTIPAAEPAAPVAPGPPAATPGPATAPPTQPAAPPTQPTATPGPAATAPTTPPAAASPEVAAVPAPPVAPAPTHEPLKKPSRRERHKQVTPAPTTTPPSTPSPSPSPSSSSPSPSQHTTPAPSHTAPAPPPPAPRRCSKADFAAVYNAAAPSKDALKGALSTLRECHTAGAITDADFNQTQAALVAKLMANP
jgi:serine/threonine-protein kinase